VTGTPPRKTLQLRLPVELHAELVKRAAEQEVSLNLLLVALLAGGVGFTLSDQ
jgi:predicted HicB family RNase H-like nuclease